MPRSITSEVGETLEVVARDAELESAGQTFSAPMAAMALNTH